MVVLVLLALRLFEGGCSVFQAGVPVVGLLFLFVCFCFRFPFSDLNDDVEEGLLRERGDVRNVLQSEPFP